MTLLNLIITCQKATAKRRLTLVMALVTAAPLLVAAENCIHNYSEVRLEVTSADVLYDPLNGGVGAFLTHVTNRKIKGLEIYSYAITDAKQLRQIILGHKSECRRIKELSILSHGDLGFLAFPENPLQASNLVDIFYGLREAFADNPRIRISGCNIAKGCLGRAFLLSLASMITHNRSILKGSTQLEISWFRVAPFVPINLFRQVLIFDSTLTKYKFSIDTAPCTSEMEGKAVKLNEFLRRTQSPSEKQIILEAIVYIRQSGKDLETMSQNIFSKSKSELEVFLKKAYDSEEKFQVLLEQYGTDKDKLANKYRLFNK